MPVVMEDGYSASGWLGIITAGALWVPLFDTDTFDAGIDQLVQQIRHSLPDEGKGESQDQDAAEEEEDGEEEDEEVLFTAAEVQAELERLRADLSAAGSRPKPVARREAGQEIGPCTLPAGVPPLPSGLRVSGEMRQLGLALLSPTSQCRVGFCGTGGVGKTCMSSWLVRREDVRQHYDAIAWVALGQSPNIGKCQDLLHLQLTGSELAPELGREERHEMLQRAMSGVKLLLCLDDCWDPEHERQLNFVDETAGGRALISSRVRGLLAGGDIFDVGLPSEDEAVQMLMAAAGAAEAAVVPAEALAVVRLCKCLPLTIGMAGKLVTELSLGGDWAGILEALEEEFEEARSMEESVIAASLRAISGRHRAEILLLFKAMALIPEDVPVPLEVLAMMYEAEVSTDADTPGSKRPTLMNLRRWTRVLQQRSLVLGTVDKPSLHDIP
eukprot:SAG22_NODE_4022_length_1418_cov_1.245641_1_plen_441_part_10